MLPKRTYTWPCPNEQKVFFCSQNDDDAKKIKQENIENPAVKRKWLKNTHILESYFQNESVIVKPEHYQDLIEKTGNTGCF